MTSRCAPLFGVWIVAESSRVVQLGLATRGLLESLLGSWVAIFLLRRRMLSLVDVCFRACWVGTRRTIIRLSPALKAEFSQDLFYTLGAQDPILIRPRRAALRHAAKRPAPPAPDPVEPLPPEAPEVFSSAPCQSRRQRRREVLARSGASKKEAKQAQSFLAAQQLLQTFEPSQFLCSCESPELTQPGALDPRLGAPWLLTFEIKCGPAQDLDSLQLRRKLLRLMALGAFNVFGAAPVCASFSRAVRPPVRSATRPQGLPRLSRPMFRKVAVGNSQNAWVLEMRNLSREVGTQ